VSEPSLPEKLLAIDDRLTDARLDHAFGGALALAYYAEPRATIDIDVNVFAPASEHDAVLAALAPLGVEAGDATPEAAQCDGQCRWWWGRNPIDVFFAYDELHEAMREAINLVPFGDERIPILSPEHLLVCKVVYDRPKDWIDIEQVLAAEAELDPAEVQAWLDRLLAADDPRIGRFGRLADRSR